MQFVCAFPRILQAICEADQVQGPDRVSNLDVTDAYHCGTLWLDQVGAFAYVVPAASENNCVIICINLVLPMGWVDSPNYFCAFSETLTDMANALVHTLLLVPAYGVISLVLKTGLGPPHITDSLMHINCYMDDVITAVQGGADRQHKVFDGTVQALKWLFPSLPGENNDSVRVKKLMSGEGNWTCQKRCFPSRAKTPGTPPTARHPGHATPNETEGTGVLVGETTLHAPHGDPIGSTPLPYPARLDTRRKRQGLSIGGLP